MKTRAFTIVELLVVTCVALVLGSLIISVALSAKEKGDLTREISAARNLVNGYLASAAENDGQLIPGYTTTPGDVVDDLGHHISYPASGRYGWRVAKYLRGPVKGTLIVNKHAKLTEGQNHEYFVYMVSLLPSFGINGMFVGGNETGIFAPTPATINRFGNFCVTNLVQAVKPSSLIVFCSARFRSTDGEFMGYHMVDPPSTTTRKWVARYIEDDPPEAFGHVHLRHDGKAVAAMLDGHVELLDEKQIQDMRRWSNQAAEADDPNFALRKL